MTEIYLIRHTQAEGNLYRAMQGHWDGDVTALGREQVNCLAERFRDVHIDTLWSSDLYRTRYTASAITRFHDIPMRTSEALREINVGPWETRFFGNLLYEQPDAVKAFITASPDWHVEGAETYANVRDRVYPALKAVAEENEGKTVAVVSHGVAILCMMQCILGVGSAEAQAIHVFGNTSVTHLFWQDRSFKIDYMNDCSHLELLHIPAWERTPDLRSEPFDPRTDRTFYEACYTDAWLNAHGNLNGFCADAYWVNAIRHYDQDHEAVLRVFNGDDVIGLIDMDPTRGKADGYGWLSFFYLKPDYRRRGLAVQLLGRPLLHFKDLGRASLRLTAAECNRDAVRFYKKWGFRVLSVSTASNGPLYLMERSLEVHCDG